MAIRLQLLPYLAAALTLAAPAPARGSDLLTNGNFDAAQPAPWVENTGGLPVSLIVGPGVAPVTPQSGDKLAWLGGVNIDAMSLHQDFAVPPGTSTLAFAMMLQIATAEPEDTPYDFLRAEIQNTAGEHLELLGQWSNADHVGTWQPFSRTVQGDYSGQTIRLRFSSLHDAIYVTNFFIDSVVLEFSGPIGVAATRPTRLAVSPAAPNPTRGTTSLRLDLPARATVRAVVFDVTGRRLRGITDRVFDPGVHVLAWDGRDARAVAVPPGVYLCRVEIDGRVFTRAIAIVR